MKDFFQFLNDSPTAFHTVANIVSELEEDCFNEFSAKESWQLFPGRKGYVIQNGSAIIAFALPHKPAKGFRIYAAHSDSPSFRLKENPCMNFEGKYVRVNTEKYGGMIYSSWLDRPLSIAGRVIVDADGRLEQRLVNIERDLAVIPNVAIHMNSDINKGYEYKPQNDLLAIVGAWENADELSKLIAREAKVEAEDILGSDLFLYPRQQARKIGLKEEFILSPRLDDLECVYAGMKAMIEAEPGDYIRVLAVFDNEEVGSSTKQGADSTFLEDTLYRIAESLSLSRTDYLKLLSESFMISADNAHAVHPAMPSKADPVNKPYMNGGVVLKFNGNQRYATDAYSAAFIRKICKENDIKLQVYVNNSDIPGGSTLGNISASHVSIPTADIGLAQLAMHSACETAGAGDLSELEKLAIKFFEK